MASRWGCPYQSDFPFQLFTIAANNTGVLMTAVERTVADSLTLLSVNHPAVLQHSFRAAHTCMQSIWGYRFRAGGFSDKSVKLLEQHSYVMLAEVGGLT